MNKPTLIRDFCILYLFNRYNFRLSLKCWLLITACIVAPGQLIAQINNLKNQLTSKISEEERVKVYNHLATAYWKEQLDSSALYADKAFQLASKLRYQEGIANALVQKGIVLSNYGKDQEALELLEKAKNIALENGYREIVARSYYHIGKTYKNQPDSTLLSYKKSTEIAKELGLEKLIHKNMIGKSRIYLHQKRHQEISELYNAVLPELQKEKDFDGLIEIYTYMSLAFRDLNEKEKALLYAEKALGLMDKSQDKKLQAFVYGVIGSGVVSYFESFEKAEPLVRKSLRLATDINDVALVKSNHKRLALLYLNNEDIEKASIIIDSLLISTDDPDIFKFKGIILSDVKKFEEANVFFDKAYKLYAKDKAYIQQKITLQFKIDNKLARTGNEDLTDDFYLLDSLNTIIHDTESKSQFFDLETKYRTAEKEAEIQKKELELVKSRNRILLISGIALLLFGLGGFSIWVMRNKQRRKELEHANHLLELQHNFNTIELANLNNQLNPHEIKNLITSIAPELITKAPEAYKKMIKLFNVTRASLTNKLTEPLAIQITQVDDFLQLQQSISPYTWHYEIENDLEDSEIELPRLLLKNMVENAVKYGMRSLKENGMIRIVIFEDDQFLEIHITDNGKGINPEKNEESTGVGLSTYQKLFALANAKNQQKASLILKRAEPWTTTEIRIPFNYQY